MTDTIFDQKNEEEITSYRDRLVGEGKKFKDDEALARGKWEADQFAESLKRENAEMRIELQSRLNMDELVNKLGKTASTNGTPPSQEPTPSPTPVQPTPGLTSDDVQSIVKNTLTKEQTKLQQDRNLTSVANALQKAWGDDWVSKLRKVGNSLDMTEEQMDTLAKTTPKVLLGSVLKEPEKVDNDKFVAPRSSIMGTVKPQDSKGWDYYEQMRKTDPRKYYTASVQAQFHKDVQSGKVILPS